MELKKLEEAIAESWEIDTCYPPWQDRWSEENPALGQCAVTSLVVQDYLGGELVYCMHNHHYWNRLPSGKEIDFTRQQFPEGTQVCADSLRGREELLSGEIVERYEILRMRVKGKVGF